MSLINVQRQVRPPSKLEGGGFTIKDLLSGFSPTDLDPFLIWHELPKAFYRPGEMPGTQRTPPHAAATVCVLTACRIRRSDASSSWILRVPVRQAHVRCPR